MELKFDSQTLQRLANDEIITDREPWVTGAVEEFVESVSEKIRQELNCSCLTELEPYPHCPFHQLLICRDRASFKAPPGRKDTAYLRLLISRLGPFYEASEVKANGSSIVVVAGENFGSKACDYSPKKVLRICRKFSSTNLYPETCCYPMRCGLLGTQLEMRFFGWTINVIVLTFGIASLQFKKRGRDFNLYTD